MRAAEQQGQCVDMIRHVSLHDYEHGSPAVRRAIVDETLDSLRTGFVYVEHGLSGGMLDEVYGKLQSFFTLDTATKQQYSVPGSFGQSGYTGLLVETAAGESAADWKEMLNWSAGVGSTHPAARRWPELYHPPVFPDAAVPGIGSLLRDFHTVVFDLQRRFLHILADGLGVAGTFFDRFVADHTTLSRAIHYPAMSQVPDGVHVWAAAHADINLITALPRATAPGLQLDIDGEWIDVVTDDHHAVINTGIMLEVLTNGLIMPGIHRVVADGDSTDRYSIVQFCHPLRGAILQPLDTCVTEQRPLAYPSMQSGDALEQVLFDINLT